ncbi:MAG: PAS domain-containing protein [Balneolaceae bacterium]
MNKTVDLKYSLFIKLSARADKKLLSTLFEGEFSLTDNPETLKNGSVDLIIMDAYSVHIHKKQIVELKNELAPVLLPLLVLIGKKGPPLPESIWDIADDVIEIPVSKRIIQARVRLLLKTRKYSIDLDRDRSDLLKKNDTISMYFNAIDKAKNGILITNPNVEDNPIIFCNKTFQELTGYKKDEVIGRNCRFLQGPDTDQQKIDNLREDISLGNPHKTVLKNYKKDGTRFWNELTVSPIKTDDGTIDYFIGIQNDITELIQTQERLEQSRDEWASIVNHSPDIIQISVDGVIRFMNPEGAVIYGYSSPADLIGKTVHEMHDLPEVHEKTKERLSLLKRNETVPPIIYSFTQPNGEKKHIKIFSISVMYNGEKAVQSVGQDITNIIEAKKELEELLKQKQTLLLEIHHRVKNNLAVINSLIDIQMMGFDDEETRLTEVLRGVQSRIISISKVHELLYQQEDLNQIRYDHYVKSLTEYLSHSFGEKESIEFTLDLAPMNLSLDQAIPCGLLLNELIANTIKHGYNPADKKKIDISIQSDNEFVSISYRDYGSGLKDSDVFDEGGNFGMIVIRTLMNQLEAELDHLPGKGFHVSIRFKKMNYTGYTS